MLVPRLLWVALLLVVCSLVPQDAQGTTLTGVNVLLTSEKAVYSPGEPITFVLKVINNTSRPLRLSFRNAQRFDLVMRDTRGREVWRWSAGKIFAQVLGEERLKPSGGELLFQATVPGNLPPGEYTATGTVPALEDSLSAQTRITVQ